ncbi:MAG: protein phosphatase 2C domain-containing protein, partial [Bryobacterales bacterium]|nr:protein phosphatase 2C domain-containing protein [Bryobacterales bacterium]
MLAVVADGMGGMAHGEAAGKCAVQAFLKAYEAKSETEPIPDALLRSLHSANAAVYEMAIELDAAEEMGTTLVATVIHNERLFWISCGDSGIFLFRNGEFTLLNQPHIFAVDLDDQVANGVIPRDLAQAHPERESLTSFLGLEKITLLDRSLRSIALRAGDTVLLASGVTPRIPKIPGQELPHVLSYAELLSGAKTVGERVVIVGAGGI